MRTWTVGAAAVCLVALAGCGPKGGAANAINTAANAAPAAVDTVITAADLPKFRAGKWQEVETDNGGLPQTSTSCETSSPIDMNALGQGCVSQQIKRTAAGAYEIDISCAKEAAMRSMRLTLQGDFNASFDIDGVVTVKTPGQATSVETHHLHATYVGACDPDTSAAANSAG